jgi:hypothetical protein
MSLHKNHSQGILSTTHKRVDLIFILLSNLDYLTWQSFDFDRTFEINLKIYSNYLYIPAMETENVIRNV